MSKGKVVSLKPFVAIVEVAVELRSITISLTLRFGPFNTRKEAEAWTGEMERLHKEIEKLMRQQIEAAKGKTVLPLGPIVCAYVCGTDVQQEGLSARIRGALLRPNSPAHDARDMHRYVLRYVYDSVGSALDSLDKT